MLEGKDIRLGLSAATLALALIANIVLSVCMVHTWKRWRQVKWYILLLAIGNWIEVFFEFIVRLVLDMDYLWHGTEGMCKFVMCVSIWGPILGAMSVAAMSVHALITTITGHQGSRLRHGLVMGVFGLLSFPFPLFRLVNSRLKSEEPYEEDASICFANTYVEFFIGVGINLLFFPCLVILCALVSVAIVNCIKSKDRTRGDVSTFDSVIAIFLGLLLFVSWAPVELFFVTTHYFSAEYSWVSFIGLSYVTCLRNILSVVIVVVFAYAYFGPRPQQEARPAYALKDVGERQTMMS